LLDKVTDSGQVLLKTIFKVVIRTVFNSDEDSFILFKYFVSKFLQKL